MSHDLYILVFYKRYDRFSTGNADVKFIGFSFSWFIIIDSDYCVKHILIFLTTFLTNHIGHLHRFFYRDGTRFYKEFGPKKEGGGGR